jgi:hypothetical protein
MTSQVIEYMVGWEGIEPSTSGLKECTADLPYLYEMVGRCVRETVSHSAGNRWFPVIFWPVPWSDKKQRGGVQ